MENRITMVRERLKNDSLDALFVSDQYNVTYLTGFAGLSPHEREVFLLVTTANTYLLTFSTYYDLYKDATGYIPLCITATKRLSDHLNDIISKERIKTVGIEKDNLTLVEYESLTNKVLAQLKQTSGIIDHMRPIKSPEEVALIKKAADLTDTAFRFIQRRIKPGVTEKSLALDLEYFMKRKGDDIAFTPIVAFNDHAAIPHYMPSGTKLIADSLVLLDFGAKIGGYCADMTRVVFLGTPRQDHAAIYQVVKDAQQRALDAIKPGAVGGDIDQIARDAISAAQYPPYSHGLGHGVGMAIHEAPRLKLGGTDVLKEQMVVTVEPGIYLSGVGGVRIEDLVVVTKTGCDILSKSPKEMIIL